MIKIRPTLAMLQPSALHFLCLFIQCLVASSNNLKRTASDQDLEGQSPEKRLRVQASEDEEVGVVAIIGDDLSLDIWQTIFHNSDGFSIHPFSAVCKRFRNRILQPDLLDKFHSPEATLEGLMGSSELIFEDKAQLLSYALPAAIFPLPDVARISKLLCRCGSRPLLDLIIKDIRPFCSPQFSSAMADQVLIEYASFMDLPSTFPKTFAEFEKHVVEDDIDIWNRYESISLLDCLLIFTSSKVLTNRILDTAMTGIWLEYTEGSSMQVRELYFHVAHTIREISRLFRRFGLVAASLNKDCLEHFNTKLMVLASLYHNASNNFYHGIFRSFLSHTSLCSTGLKFSHIKGDVANARRLLASGAVDLRELLQLAAAWKIPLGEIVETLKKWVALKGCTASLRTLLNENLMFIERVKDFKLDDLDFTKKDIPFAATIITSLSNPFEISSWIHGIWSCQDQNQFNIMLQVLSTNKMVLNHFLSQPMCFNGSFTLGMQSSGQLHRAMDIYKFLNHEFDILTFIRDDIFMAMNEPTLESSILIHKILSGLPEAQLKIISEFFFSNCSEAAILEFKQRVPYLILEP